MVYIVKFRGTHRVSGDTWAGDFADRVSTPGAPRAIYYNRGIPETTLLLSSGCTPEELAGALAERRERGCIPTGVGGEIGVCPEMVLDSMLAGAGVVREDVERICAWEREYGIRSGESQRDLPVRVQMDGVEEATAKLWELCDALSAYAAMREELSRYARGGCLR